MSMKTSRIYLNVEYNKIIRKIRLSFIYHYSELYSILSKFSYFLEKKI